MQQERNTPYVSYLRVSTQKQGHSGLGLEAQQTAVARYAKEHGGTLVQEFKEVESGRKGMKGRPELEKALAFCRKHRCSMANFAEFEARRISERTKAALAAAKARGRVLGSKGIVNLRPNIEERQRAADTFAERLRHTMQSMQDRGLSQRAIATELNQLGIKTPRGGQWSLYQVQLLLRRIKAIDLNH